MSDELFTAEEIFNATDAEYRYETVPEWGGKKVKFKSLTGTQRDDFEAKSLIQKGPNAKMNLVNMRARLLALVLVDQNDKRLFSDSAIHKLGGKNAKVLERLFGIAQEMNGMTDKDVEELTENFDNDQSENSTSD
jgi:hypothetical protein